MFKRVVITGGAGLIGRETTRKFVTSGYDVVCFDLSEQIARNKEFFAKLAEKGKLTLVQGSILDRNAVRDLMKGAEVVIHLAAMLGVKKTEDSKLACIEVNINGTDTILNAAVAHGVQKFVFASSSEVYGEPNTNPIIETHDTKGKTVYAVTKMAGEELTKGYNQKYPDMDYSIIRFFNTYGEGQVAQFVLTKWVMNVLEGKNPVIYGDGKQTRSYGHLDDVTMGVKSIVENPVTNGKVYNLGNSTQVMTLTELAQRVIDLVAPNSNLQVDILGNFDGADRDPEREIFMRYCDTTLANQDFSYEPKISIDEGILRIAAQVDIYSDWPSV